MIKQVITGKINIDFSDCIKISPGNRPKGNFLINGNKAAINIKSKPRNKNIFCIKTNRSSN
tara:strand:- start:344 stop:526 length:183 start_codon:yes stop_codon:yes gene_type:complete